MIMELLNTHNKRIADKYNYTCFNYCDPLSYIYTLSKRILPCYILQCFFLSMEPKSGHGDFYFSMYQVELVRFSCDDD